MDRLTAFFGVSVVIFILSAAFAIFLPRTKLKIAAKINTFYLFFAGFVVSAILIFWPVYEQMFGGEEGWELKTFLLSIHNTIRLFVVDGEFTFITDHISKDVGLIYTPYTTFAIILFVIAPFLTFGVVLSFFKNLSAYQKYLFGFFSDIYVFSELNDRALTLAQDMKRNDKKRLIIFTDVFEKNDELSYEMLEKAKKLGAITFKKDVAAVNFSFHSKKREIAFFNIGYDNSENIKQALKLIERYNSRKNTSLYVFTTAADGELLLNRVDKGEIKVRRINEVASLVSRLLYDEGQRIFGSAVPAPDGTKHISAVIVGMGQHGTEMAKALSWFCQMDGYRAEINAFDRDIYAKSRFSALCPELMDGEHNGNFTDDGDSQYKITVHSRCDIQTKKFFDALESLPEVTYVFVALGDDTANINAAVAIRSLMEKHGLKPVIDTVVYDSEKKKALTGITNYSGQAYDINFMGDFDSSYSEKVILHSDLERIALARHMKWGGEEDFWKYEYNYRSSIASAIHREMKKRCKIPGIEKEPKDRTEEELQAIRRMEHRRWDAYMRSEGYCYAEKRNNLAKTHHCLVTFDELSKKDQEKDDD